MTLRIKLIFLILCFLWIQVYAYNPTFLGIYSYKNKDKESDLINTNLGWQLGIGFGLYFADKGTANYYNGSGKNNLHRVIMTYPYNYDNLKEYFNYDFTLDTNNLPQKMTYTPAISLGFTSKYFFNENNAFVVDFAYSKHTASDVFALIIHDPSNLTTEPTLELGKIWGTEERVNFNIGYSFSFGKPKRIKPFWEVGININDTKVIENKAQIAGYTYDIRDPMDNYYGLKEGGIGTGFFVTQGLHVNISDGFAAQVGIQFSRKKIALPQDNLPLSQEWLIFFRIMYKNIFGSNA